jgi:RHS repeat-associated protein
MNTPSLLVKFSLFAVISLTSFNWFINNTILVGHTKTNLSVGENGEAIVQIPLNLPNGTILQPSISLAYNSHGANGLLGLGWSINGVIQTITRVPATNAQDGFIDGVDFDGNDRFALNGERLIVISGEYGTDLSSYRTEQCNFSKVISYGNTGFGPEYFKVWTKDGLIMEFGKEEDASIGVANESNKVLIWLLNKITDTNGNFININYYNGIANGEYRPTSIEYTGNEITGNAPYNKVEFYYEERPDIYPRFIAGQKSTFTQRLKNIVIYDHEVLFRRYELNYLDSVFVSKLHEVTEYGSDNSSSFQPVIANWITNPESEYDFEGTGSGYWTAHPGGVSNNVLGDFNGDGRTDMVAYAYNAEIPSQWHVNLSTGSNFIGVVWYGNEEGIVNNVSGDFNGDGLTDLAGYQGGFNWRISLSTGSGFTTTTWHGHNEGLQNNVLGDFNGDGRTDMAGYMGSGKWRVDLSTGSDFTEAVWDGHAGGAQNNVSGDFNGDGRTDLAGYTGMNGKWHVTFSTGENFIDGGYWDGHEGGVENNVTGDFNGDGLTDLAGYTDSVGYWDINLSTGTQFESSLWGGHGGGIENNVTGDFNGDGKTDLAGYSTDLGEWHVTLSTGSYFQGQFWPGQGGGPDNNVVGDFNGDGFTDLAKPSDDNSWNWHVALSNAKKELVTNVVHGNGIVSVFEHLPITNTSLYTKGTNANYPFVDFTGSMYVVSIFSTDDGVGGRRKKRYQYFDAKYDHSGRGFRGFDKILTSDSTANFRTTTIYDRDYKHIAARVKNVIYETLNGDTIKTITNTPEAIEIYNGVYFSYNKNQVEHYYNLNNGTLFNTKTTELLPDLYGNIIHIIENYNGQYVVETLNTYVNDEANWHLGRLTQAIVSKSLSGQAETVKNSTFEYDSNGNLITEILLPDHATRRLETHYTLDAYGNRIVITQSGPDIVTRSDYLTYDSDGRFRIREENALGHTRDYTYEFGYLDNSTDYDSLTTSYMRDAFGRIIQTNYPNGTSKTFSYNVCNSCPLYAIYFTEEHTTGNGIETKYYDKLDRPVKTVTEGFNSSNIHQNIRYNANGTVQGFSDPYYGGEMSYWTEYEYDELQRVIKKTSPGNEETHYNYDGFVYKVINSENQSFTTIINPMSKIVETIDQFGSEMHFVYDNDLNLISKIDCNGNVISYTFDIRGFKVAMTDPDMGTYNYEYNTLGQLVNQSYPNGNNISFEYDLLNRATKRVENEGVTEWVYDPDNGVGHVKDVFFNDNLEQSYSYNSVGKLQSETFRRNDQDKTFNYTYNSSGFLESKMYPNGYNIQYLYDSKGFPSQVIEGETNKVLWQANEYDGNGRNIQFSLGNGLTTTKTYDDITEDLQSIVTGFENTPSNVQNLSFTFSKLGNLQQRSDNNLDLTEIFEYDGLNRLTKSTVSGVDTLTVAYDLLGNIIFKSDVGNYAYNENGAGPHVLTSIDHTQIANCIYNLQQNVEFTSYNYASSISNESSRIEIDYSTERDRKQLRTYKDGLLKSTKNYAGQSYEEVEFDDGTSIKICYLNVGSNLFAYISEKNSEPKKTTYIHTDHLGSVNVLTDDNGLILERHSFDAWGKKRDPFTWERLETPLIIPADFSKGFTFHETLNIDWLVCMNARIYNPVLGRFLSPDPYIQFGENMQSMNRYSYVLNNPLSFTDPSGYNSLNEYFEDAFDFVKEHLGTVVGIAISASLGGLDGGFFAVLFSGAASGFGVAFTDAFVTSGSFHDSFKIGLEGSLWGAISAGCLYTINSIFQESNFLGRNIIKPLVQSAVKDAISKAKNGDLDLLNIHGSESSYEPVMANQYGQSGNIVVGAIVGETSSKLSGGKFANGAVSGSFISIYNNPQQLEENRTTNYNRATYGEYPSISSIGDFADIGFAVGNLFTKNILEVSSNLSGILTDPFADMDFSVNNIGIIEASKQANRVLQQGSQGN